MTALSTGLVALVSALLLWLGWLLVGGVARSVPALPPGSTVRIGDRDVPADQVAFIKINADLSRAWPSITKTKPALPDADKWKDVKNKLEQLAR